MYGSADRQTLLPKDTFHIASFDSSSILLIPTINNSSSIANSHHLRKFLILHLAFPRFLITMDDNRSSNTIILPLSQVEQHASALLAKLQVVAVAVAATCHSEILRCKNGIFPCHNRRFFSVARIFSRSHRSTLFTALD